MTSKPMIAALGVSITLMSSCSTARQAGITAGVGVGVAAIGGAVMFGEDRSNSWGPSGGQLLVGLGGGLAAIGLISAFLFHVKAEATPTSPAFRAPRTCRQERQERRERALRVENAQERGRLLASLPTCNPLSAADRVQQEHEAARSEAWALTKTAAAAARAGDCATVKKKIDPQVLALDSEFYKTVFRADVAINHCIAAPDDQPPAASVPP